MPPPALRVEEIGADTSVSLTWSIDQSSGTMRHKQTGTKVSQTEGITYEGHEYKLRLEDIQVGEGTLGSGACGVVTKGFIKSTGEPIALKTIKVDDKGKREQLLNEIRGLVQATGCPQLVQWYAGYVTPATSSVQVVLEFMDLGSLADLKKRSKGQGVPPNYLACIAQQVMLGIVFLHTKSLMHRDIKPENILHNTKGEVKLTDFGIAKDLDTTLKLAVTFVGTVTYFSPERCWGNDYDLKSDVWSVGMVFFELAIGRYPFSEVSTFPALFDHLCEKPEPRLDPAVHPHALCDFVAKCLTRDVIARLDSEQLLSHELITVGVPSQADLATYLKTLLPG